MILTCTGLREKSAFRRRRRQLIARIAAQVRATTRFAAACGASRLAAVANPWPPYGQGSSDRQNFNH